MGNRQCGHCFSCYDDQYDRNHVKSKISPRIDIHDNDKVDVVPVQEFVLDQKLERIEGKLATMELQACHKKYTKYNSHTNKVPDRIKDENNLTLIDLTNVTRTFTNEQENAVQRHFSKTFSTDQFRSMSSESMGRETRTEHSMMRRLSSTCERDDIYDEIWMSRSYDN